MPFTMPSYRPPDFDKPPLADAPAARFAPAPADGVAPEGFHATSNHPEYVRMDNGDWALVAESRMDCALVLRGETIEAVELRRLKAGDPVALGRRDDGEDGLYVHTTGFQAPPEARSDKFSFRVRGTRETPFSRSYDALYDLLRHDRDHGRIIWTLGPAVAFDKDSRDAMQGLIESGYCHALMAGNALATHDLEAARFRTGLGQDIYTQTLRPQGHYNHLDILNTVRRIGSIAEAMRELNVKDGIIYACEKCDVPYVLAGSIRDDGPMPGVIVSALDAQDEMRKHARTATTVIAVATQLHTIAFGNMTPGYRALDDGVVRPVYFYVVDMSEFSADKLANRGSSQSIAILTNAQDFVVNLWNNLRESATA